MKKEEILNHIKKIKIDRDCKYLLLMDEKYFSKEEARLWAETLRNFGYECLVGRVRNLNSIKFIKFK